MKYDYKKQEETKATHGRRADRHSSHAPPGICNHILANLKMPKVSGHLHASINEIRLSASGQAEKLSDELKSLEIERARKEAEIREAEDRIRNLNGELNAVDGRQREVFRKQSEESVKLQLLSEIESGVADNRAAGCFILRHQLNDAGEVGIRRAIQSVSDHLRLSGMRVSVQCQSREIGIFETEHLVSWKIGKGENPLKVQKAQRH